MTILITRPSPYGEQLVYQLNSAGKTAWHLPLITFSPGTDLLLLEEQLKTLSNNDFLFVMSQTAINYAHSRLITLNMTWPKQIHYYAIGYATALKTHKCTKITPILYPKTKETSEELLRLPTLNNNRIQGKQALILSGNKRRTILQKTLQKRGFQVINCQSYSQIPIQYNGEEKTQFMLKIGITTIVITSQEILQHLYNLIPNYHRKTWLINCKLIVISNRLAIHAKILGWKNITIVTTTNKKKLINTLLNI
ncbi:uroporphyrinogen-III synthase [Blochmannia endosymbiont of Polyrhachis (Hedomyrma) turneri]|uniref:uroporphyrinogen-III synthase n=1 Tax=Blochmannia endosymbiont of Polyrhachis (Hedomyrma) turneri TaxID=1505596 RepID=UPI00061A5DC2|nr:uroporphyrinogen-III synthase [Blochmannia endosymbiont of Polyrhachis (Hedomyrma) turneri]AKC60139.1 uroporphyrinogen-III synthase [Blochmannia endosymbiont of Polyrhachis (Hedomyrma) turneri]